MSVLETIREEIKQYGEKLYSDPNATESSKEYYECIKETFSNVMYIRSSSKSFLLTAIVSVNKDLPASELFDRYDKLVEEVNQQFILDDDESRSN